MGGIFGKKKGPPSKIFIDFKNTKPAAGASKALYDDLTALLQTGEQLTVEFSNYQGCQEAIKNSMTSPKDMEVQRASFLALFPNIQVTKRAYDYAKELEAKLPLLVLQLVNNTSNLEDEEALVKCLADVMDISLRFDGHKMMNSAIQNDFAHYRRSMANHRDIENIPVTEAGTNQISMFMAVPNPLIKTCADVISTLFHDNNEVVKLLAEMANICCSIVMTEKADGEGLLNYCLNVMTASIVLFDVIVPTGVFKKNSGVDMRNCVLQLQKYDKKTLINNLKYSTKTYKSDNTPSSLRNLIEGD